jgi:hypothetical protein
MSTNPESGTPSTPANASTTTTTPATPAPPAPAPAVPDLTLPPIGNEPEQTLLDAIDVVAAWAPPWTQHGTDGPGAAAAREQ